VKKEVTDILLKWWDAMGAMYEKYGDALDIEEKPEWPEMCRLQQEWVDTLAATLGSDPDVLFDKATVAMSTVLDESESPTALTREQADEIVRLTVDLTLASEARAAKAIGMLN
jgi:hypothetical protein